MPYCKDCQYFNGFNDPNEWKGECDLQLPPMIEAVLDNVGYNRLTRADSRCDLGKSKVRAE